VNENIKCLGINKAEMLVVTVMFRQKVLNSRAATVQKGIAHLVSISTRHNRVLGEISRTPFNITIATLFFSHCWIGFQCRADVRKCQENVQKRQVALGLLAPFDLIGIDGEVVPELFDRSHILLPCKKCLLGEFVPLSGFFSSTFFTGIIDYWPLIIFSFNP